jgi:hypothetical protein
MSWQRFGFERQTPRKVEDEDENEEEDDWKKWFLIAREQLDTRGQGKDSAGIGEGSRQRERKASNWSLASFFQTTGRAMRPGICSRARHIF